MKNILKNKVFYFVLGAIIFATVGAYAATLIASEIAYTNNNQENVQGAIDDLYSKTLYLGKIKVGDYVSMTPTLEEYTIASSETGKSSDQTINPSELNIWRIISINSDGTADAVSEYVSSTNIFFVGKEGYQNSIGSLNKIATSYANSKYVVRTRHIGYGGGTQYITDNSKLIQISSPWMNSTSNSTSPTDEIIGAGEMGYEYDYNLIQKVLGTTIANRVGTTTATIYWMASRYYNYYHSSRWSFGVRDVVEDGEAYGCGLYYYNGNSLISDSYNNAIRPIITLKSNLTTSGGDGKSEATAWTFN